MAKKNKATHHKINKNQKHRSLSNPEIQALVSYLNRVITAQNYLFESNFNLKLFIRNALTQLLHLTKAIGAAVELIDNGKTSYHAAIGSLKKHLGLSFNLTDSISALSINTHQIIRCDDTEEDARINKKIIRSIGNPYSFITIPLFHAGKTIGAVKIVANKRNHFNDMAAQVSKIIGGLINDGISKNIFHDEIKKLVKTQKITLENLKKTEKKLEYASQHDYLTGLANCNFLNEQLTITLKKAKRKNQLIALMYLDIDNFKKINETFGHSTGDKLLCAFAMRLKQCIRSSDVIARLGGDEFILLIDDIKEVQDGLVIVDKILQSMRKPFNLKNKFINITTSIGITFLNDPNISPDEFIKQADQALYISKNSGRNTFYIYNPELLHETINIK